MGHTDKIYDVAVIGGGPGGYTAAIYSARAGLDTIVIEKFSAGGQMTQTDRIDNYPGFEEGIDGFTLGYKMQMCAERFGAVTVQAEVLGADLSGREKLLTTSAGTINARCIVIATGAKHKHLGVENEEKLLGKGVGYCASCDGMFFKGKDVAVVGGGNSAAADALLLSKICRSVTLIHRRDSLRAERFYSKSLNDIENITFCWNSTVDSFVFDDRIRGVKIKNALDDTTTVLDIDGVFISIGRTPQTKLFENQLEINEHGYIVADETTRTSVDGVFAVGDVRSKPVRQIVTAVADGATAIHYAEEYLFGTK